MYRPYRGLAALACVGMALLVVGCPVTPPIDNAIAPVASFEINPVVGFAPLRVQFSDTSTPGTSPIRQWYWAFGDGAQSTDRNPSHIYMLPGVYTVSLTVTTAVGVDQRVCVGCVTVKEPSTVAAIGRAGGHIETEGGGVDIPGGAFTGDTLVGMTFNEGNVPVNSTLGERVVSDVFGIYQGAGDLRVDPRTPITITLPMFLDMVPEADRVPEKLQIFAYLATGLTVPVLGAVQDSNFVASVAGLPQSAQYAVVYRPVAAARAVDVEAVNAKTPTSYAWPSDLWRVFYTPSNLQELTGLRLGDLINLGLYDVRTYSAMHIANTVEDLDDSIARIHAAYRDAGFISPLLPQTQAGEYRLIIFNMNRPTTTTYTRLSDVNYVAAPFGDIVVDPGQLIAICKKNSTLGLDQMQEVEFSSAFAQGLFRAVFRGYDYPKALGAPTPDYTPALFSQGLEDAMTTYLGQVMAGLTTPRSLGPNETLLLNESLFTPISTAVTGYSYAGQDFLFYTANRYGIAQNPAAYLADSYDGALEHIRLRELALGASPSYDSALAAGYLGFDLGLQRASFHAQLPNLYWDFVKNRAYENNEASRMRISETGRDPYSFNTAAFASTARFTGTFQNTVETRTYSSDYIPALKNIAPLSSRAFVFDVTSSISSDLKISVNAGDWGTNGDLRVKAYKDGQNGVELTLQTPTATLTGFGVPRGFTRAIVIVSNVSLSQSYDLTLTAETRATSVITPTGALSGTVRDSATQATLAGATVTVYLRTGSTIGQVLATATTNNEGVYLIPSVLAGEVEVAVSRSGYVTQRIDTSITASVSNVLDVNLVRNAK